MSYEYSTVAKLKSIT